MRNPKSSFTPYKSTFDVSQLSNSNSSNTRMKDEHRYNALRPTEDPEMHSNLSRSSTEVDDVEEEAGTKMHQPGRWKKKKTFWSKVKRWRWAIDTGLLLVILGLVIDRRWDSGETGRGGFDMLGDITGFAPKFSQQIVSFKPNETFAPENPLDWWSNRTQQAWLDIVPGGLGYVNVANPHDYNNLPRPLHDYPNNTVYTTSLTHQLHCLYTIVEAYNVLQVAWPSSQSNARNPIHMPWHINHCFEYMRQAIMCAGDVALEGAQTTFPPGNMGEDLGGSDGWDARHVCKDYSQVIGYLEEKAINHNRWIATTEI